MQYLVSSENHPQYHWQLEILIESFRMLGLEEKLVVCLAESDATSITRNLLSHPNKVLHKNVGHPANEIAAMRSALDSGGLGFPFVLVRPDMILLKPVEIGEEDRECGVIFNNFDENQEGEEAETRSGILSLAARYGIDPDEFAKISEFGWPVLFNNPVEEHFDAFLYETMIREKDLFEGRGSNFSCERVAWKISLSEISLRTPVAGRFMCGPILFDHDNMNFISYSRGMPPTFHKKHYNFFGNFHLSGLDPIESLAEAGATVNSDHARRVIESYKSKQRR